MAAYCRFLAGLVLGLASWAWAQDPFAVEAVLRRGPPAAVEVTFRVPAGHYLYGHMLAVEPLPPGTATLTPIDPPKGKRKYDDLLEREVETFDRDTRFTYQVEGLKPDAALTLAVGYQGCTDEMCFMPQRVEIALTGDGDSAPTATPAPAPTAAGALAGQPWRNLAERFEIVGTGTGYMNSKDFLAFLRQAESGQPAEANLLEKVFRRHGLLAALLLVIPLGLLLNLTPCVLPMIPINLAIIGAGQEAGSRRTGAWRGAVYGAGMALVYGLLGVVVVLTGSRFGALNASPWFNLAIAAVFVVLGLAMFDVLLIDLSRFQRAGGAGPQGRSSWLGAFLLGGTAALLAGACVAPVLIWVLVLATSLYAQGNPGGLLLPLMLGVGMALPWPVAGAGLAVLPRPGQWMNRVKYAFGVLILLFAVYYASLGVRLYLAQRPATPAEAAAAVAASPDGWNPDLTVGLGQAAERRQPVFLDFWALTCKSCLKMKKTTFKDPEVVAALEPYVRIAFQTDDLKDPVVQGALDYYKVLGLPTYVVLRPRP